ncbi:MAG: alpha/beta hydrolase [Verrucomicrobiales bacterium]|nr:alpha/beta hydrolase [Verrucomicrobiales bacterium]
MMTLTVRFLFLLVILYSISFVPLSADENPEINLWPAGAVPDEPEGIEKRKKPTTIDKVGKMRIAYVDEPSITVYKAPKERSNGTSVIIFPGGGYNILAWTHEGTEIAEWLNSLGVSAFVLKYRVPRRDPEKPHTLPLQDAQRAIRIVRSRSKEWGIDPGRIGVLGFSAGGHLAVMSGTHYGDKTYERIDDADDLSSRPDFLIPIYPAYLGDRKNRDQLSGLVDINKNTPPMFIAITHDDSDRAYYSALLYAALKKSGVVGELHIYSKGGHGYGMRKSKDPVHTWPDRCADWLGSMGLLGP